jgi:hypothetical protein
MFLTLQEASPKKNNKESRLLLSVDLLPSDLLGVDRFTCLLRSTPNLPSDLLGLISE